MNPDIESERKNSSINLEKMKQFLGEILYGSNYPKLMTQRNQMVKKIKPLFEENFYNLDRNEKYEMMVKKTLEFYEFVQDNDIKYEDFVKIGFNGGIFGAEKLVMGLHFSAFMVSIDLWSNAEQRDYWFKYVNENVIFGTYVQTELGHGTFVRGLETTATYDKTTQEFVIHSPTLTSTKFWPGAAALSCNYAIVMAKLIIDQIECGIHAFVVQLRCVKTHALMKGVETGDIGKKFGFDSMDNGYVRFDQVRVPRFNMLMKNARVTADGKFERIGSELIMYACMLLLRGALCLFSSSLLTISTTIAIRYSCVRRQTVNDKGLESQIMDYQTQQYRLLPGLATTYAHFFAANNFMKILVKIKTETNFFATIQPPILSKLHAVSAGLKAVGFNNCLKFAQLNRLCCGGHGYSASSGLSQILIEADGGSTYEGDNVILLLQTARYLLKSAQKNAYPHLIEWHDLEKLAVFKCFASYLDVFRRLFEQLLAEVSSKLLALVTERGFGEQQAWNECSVDLITTAKSFTLLFLVSSNLVYVDENKTECNQKALAELFELFLLYEMCENNSANLLRLNILNADEMNKYSEKLYNLLPKVRLNAVTFVDSFDYLDSNLCSSLGVYDGNVYERLYEFAQNSKFNDKDVHEVYYKYLEPYVQRHKSRNTKAKL